MRAFFVLCAALWLAGCANSGTGVVPPKTVEEVDLQRYQGTWYELARLPTLFQRNCAQSEAHYQSQGDGSLAVTNRCRSQDGEWQQVTGRAEPQVAGETDKLWVRFDNGLSQVLPGLSKGDYWVLYLDDDYRSALVGTPDHDQLWLLSRTPEVAPEIRATLLKVAHGRGYAVEELIWRLPDAKLEP